MSSGSILKRLEQLEQTSIEVPLTLNLVHGRDGGRQVWALKLLVENKNAYPRFSEPGGELRRRPAASSLSE